MTLVLTLTQPWASLVASGQKRIETRSWRTHYRGKILIHASQRMPMEAREIAIGFALEGLISFTEPEAMPRGMIIATAKLRNVVPVEELTPEQRWGRFGWEEQMGDYSPGRFAWLLEDVKPIEFVPAKGRLGLWDYTGPVEVTSGAATDHRVRWPACARFDARIAP